MSEVYLEVYSLTDPCNAPIETVVTLFTINYCDSKINVKLVPSKCKPREREYKIDLSNFVYEIVDMEKIPYVAKSCELPVVSTDKMSCIAGLCATLRQIIKNVIAEYPKHYCRKLLGFRDSCLMACSEASVWTRFCEIDLIRTLNSCTRKMGINQNCRTVWHVLNVTCRIQLDYTICISILCQKNLPRKTLF